MIFKATTVYLKKSNNLITVFIPHSTSVYTKEEGNGHTFALIPRLEQRFSQAFHLDPFPQSTPFLLLSRMGDFLHFPSLCLEVNYSCNPGQAVVAIFLSIWPMASLGNAVGLLCQFHHLVSSVCSVPGHMVDASEMICGIYIGI